MEVAINFTDSAVSKVRELIEEESNPDLKLRVFITGGGCSGFQYTFLMDDLQNSDDQVFEHVGAKVVIDEVSLSLIDESTLDYSEDLSASMFTIKNPMAKSGCGCGNSFSI